MMRIAAVLLSVFASISQVGADTVFSFHGLGDPIRRVDARSRSMGGSGRSLADGLNFSTHNPALLAAFRKASASVQFIAQSRSLSGGGVVNDGDVGAFQLAVPFGRGVIVGIGLEPLTDMDFGAVDNIGAGDLGYALQVEATGGVQSVSLGLGYRMGQRLYLGGRLNWVAIGTLNESWTKTFNGTDILFSEDKIIRTHRGWLPSLGFIYSPAARWRVGGNVQIGQQIRQRQNLKNLYISTRDAFEIETQSDVDIAHEFGFGATYLAGYRWLASFDVSRSLWARTGAGRFNTWDISGGALWRTGSSDILVRSRRLELTTGLHYRSLYFPTTTGSQISELGASFGIALPFKHESGQFRYVLEVGRRGDRAKHGASERFIQQSFSVTGFVR